MIITAQVLIDLFQLSLANPRKGAEAILGLSIPKEAHWLLVALVAVLTTILSGVSQFIIPAQEAPPIVPLPTTLPGILGFSVINIIAVIFAIHLAGRAFKSQGSFGDCVVLICSWELIKLVMNLGAILLVLLSPVLGMLAMVVIFGYSFWVLVHFADVIFQFNAVGKSALLVLLAFLGIGILGIMILGQLGLLPTEGLPNA